MLDMRYSNSIRWITAGGPGPAGLRLQIAWEGGEAVVHIDVPTAAQAAPGIAHGGLLAALADHLMGFVAAQHGGAVATRQMTVDYLAPTPTSRTITIRAHADEITGRAIVVSLDGRVDDSGRVTFKARGDYARVRSSRPYPGVAGTDYETLEERFDPAQVFAWLTDALKESFRPGIIGAPVLLAVDVSDAAPRYWTFTATDRSLDVAAGEPASWDVRYTGTVRSWRELVYGVKSAEELIAAGSAAIDDPNGRLAAFLAAVTDQGGRRS